MLYLIGGAARVGKSTLARRVVAETHAYLVATDTIVFTLQTAAPQLGIRFPIMSENADPVIPFVASYVQSAIWSHESAVVEGVALFPRHVEQFAAIAGDQEVRCVLLGHVEASTESIRIGGGWAASGSPSERESWADMTRRSSRHARDESARLGLPYVDIGNGWEQAIAAAEAALIH